MNNLIGTIPLLMGAPPVAGGTGGAGGGQLFTTFITFGLVIAIFYFLIIRPQNKRQKETKRMIAEIKKGDRIATAGGIRGKVMSVRDDTVVVKVDTNTKLEISKSAVSSVLEQAEAKAAAKKKEVEADVEEEEEFDETEETSDEDES